MYVGRRASFYTLTLFSLMRAEIIFLRFVFSTRNLEKSNSHNVANTSSKFCPNEIILGDT